jgi:hypothetical protein
MLVRMQRKGTSYTADGIVNCENSMEAPQKTKT